MKLDSADKKALKIGAIVSVVVLCLAVGLNVFSSNYAIVRIGGEAGLGMGVRSEAGSPYEIHATTSFYKSGVLIQQQYHAGVVVNLGLNLTCAKLSGYNPTYNITTYAYNLTYISIGNAGTLNAAITKLPGEWNRTLATVEDCAANSFNLTCTFYPSGSQTADCIGVNYQAGIGNNALFCYDTFAEVTGIDDTFTIIVEFKITVASA